MTEAIIGAAIAVHRELGPGLPESAYEACLACELTQRELRVERQKVLALQYRGVRIDYGCCIDLLVEGGIIVELKSVEQLQPIHDARMHSYLKLSTLAVGLLINFNVRLLEDGLRRFVL